MDTNDNIQPINKEEEFNTVLGEYEEAMNKAIVEAAQSQVEEKKKRKRTYLNSEIPVRPCTKSCPHRNTCKDFIGERVRDNDPCRPELRQIKKWQVAFRKGDLDQLKDDVGTVAGSMAVQVNRLIEQVILDGVVVETEKITPHGKYKEKMAHPALQQAANIMKSLGIDLGAFLMTPKSAKDAGPQTQINIAISADQVHQRFASRFGKKEYD